MARDVPRDQPLSDDDREYLLSRGQEELVRGMDERFGSGGSSQPQPEEPVPYENWSVDDLKNELRIRKLPVNGTKDQLVTRLEDDDDEAESPI